MTTNYAAGQQIAVQGIPSARLSDIALEYVRQNMGSIHATQQDYQRFVGIKTQLHGTGSNEQRMARLQELRADALEGKTGAEAASINRTYDLALSYYGIHTELLAASRASGAEPFRLPSLAGRLAHSTTYVSPYGGGGVTAAGAWRERAETGAHERRQAQTTARRAAMAPLNAALDELPQADRASVTRMVARANREAEANGVTDPAAMVNNMRAAFEAQDDWHWTIDSSTADKAKDLLERAQAIAAERGVSNIFAAPTIPLEQRDRVEADSPAAPSGGEGAGEGAGTGPEAGGETSTGGAPVEGASGGRAWTPIDTAVQFDLEALGLDTGQPGGWDASQGAAAMDGKNGRKTRAAIAQFRASKPEYAEMTDEQLFAALRTEAAAARADQGQPAPETGGQDQPATEAPIATTATPGAAAAAAAMAANNQDQNDNNYGNISRERVGALLSFAGITLTPEQLARITVEGGNISGPDILRLEQALNAIRGDAPAMQEDGKWDARLTQIAQASGVQAFIGAIFSGAASTADSQAPGGAGAGGGQAPQR